MNSEQRAATMPRTDGWLGPGHRQAAARDAYWRSVEEGAPLSAAALAAQFDRSPRWAQDRIAEARRPAQRPPASRSHDGSDGPMTQRSMARPAVNSTPGRTAARNASTP